MERVPNPAQRVISWSAQLGCFLSRPRYQNEDGPKEGEEPEMLDNPSFLVMGAGFMRVSGGQGEGESFEAMWSPIISYESGLKWSQRVDVYAAWFESGKKPMISGNWKTIRPEVEQNGGARTEVLFVFEKSREELAMLELKGIGYGSLLDALTKFRFSGSGSLVNKRTPDGHPIPCVLVTKEVVQHVSEKYPDSKNWKPVFEIARRLSPEKRELAMSCIEPFSQEFFEFTSYLTSMQRSSEKMPQIENKTAETSVAAPVFSGHPETADDLPF